MNRNDLEALGQQLRSIGHRRHELAHRVYEGGERGDPAGAEALYRELSDVTGQAINLMERQLAGLGEHLGVPERRPAEYPDRAIAEVRGSEAPEALLDQGLTGVSDPSLLSRLPREG